MKGKNPLDILTGVLLFILVCLTIASVTNEVVAKNKTVPLWGTSYGKTCYWHADTSESGSGDTMIWYNDYFHWDTISLKGYSRSDGIAPEYISFDDVWQYDGFKVYLKVKHDNLASAACSIIVGFQIGYPDSTYTTLRDSIEGGSIEKIYDFTDYYDSDSMGLGPQFDVTVIVGDTVTSGDASEYNRAVRIIGALCGKD